MRINKYSPKTAGLSVWIATTAMTLLVALQFGTREFTDAGLLIAWVYFSWNFYAYAFDKGMWPRTFVELDGNGKGNSSWRAFFFWFSAVFHIGIVATIVWAK